MGTTTSDSDRSTGQTSKAMWNKRKWHSALILYLLVFLLCHVVQSASTAARRRPFPRLPRSSDKAVEPNASSEPTLEATPSPPREEDGESEETRESSSSGFSGLSRRLSRLFQNNKQNSTATRDKETVDRPANKTQTSKTVDTSPETDTPENTSRRAEAPEKESAGPAWLQRLQRRPQDESKPADPSTPSKSRETKVRHAWPESVTGKPRDQTDTSSSSREVGPLEPQDESNGEQSIAEDARNAKDRSPRKAGKRGWLGRFPLNLVGDSAVQEETTAPTPETTLKEPNKKSEPTSKKVSKESPRVGDVDRGWPGWLPTATRRKEATRTKDADDDKPDDDAAKKTDDTPVETTKENDEHEARSDHTQARESAEQQKSTGPLPFEKALRDFRARFQPKRQSSVGEDDTREQSLVAEHESTGLDAVNDKAGYLESRETQHNQEVASGDKEERRVPFQAAPLLSRLQESAANATTFIRQLPWRPTKSKSDEESDDENRESSLTAQVDQEPLFDASTLNETVTTEERGEVNKTVVAARQRKPRAAPKVLKPIFDLPWTPGTVNPALTKKDDTTDPLHVRHALRNPIKVIRGLPWTPHRDESQESEPLPAESEPLPGASEEEEEEEEDEGGTLEVDVAMDQPEEAVLDDLEKDDSTSPGEKGPYPDDSRPILDRLMKYTPEQKSDEKEELEDGSAEDLQLAQKADSPTVELPSDEEELEKNLVEDIMSGYLGREEELSDSEEAEEDMKVLSLGRPSKEAKESTDKRPDAIQGSMDTEQEESGGDDQSDKLTRPLPEEPTKRSWDIGSKLKTVETVGRRREDKKKEFQPEPVDKGDQGAPVQSDSKPPEGTTEGGVPPANRTSVPDHQDGVPPSSTQGREDIRRDQRHQQPTMIIMGGQDGRPMPPSAVRPSPPSSSSVIIAEALGSIVGAVIRIWMITYFAKWWSEEETLRPIQHFVWERLNDRYERDAAALQNVLHMPPANVSERKWRRFLRKQHRAEGKVQRRQPLSPQMFQRTVLVLEISGELNIPHLEQAVTFILSQYREQAFGNIGGFAKELEVVLLIESPGGSVQDFGLAAAQVDRLSHEAGITTTACVDKIAASGGYMIASQAHRINAAPFATVGSIGVIREGLNIHDALLRHGIKTLTLKAGDSKVPLSMLGPVTNRDMAKAQRTLDQVHKAFQQLVASGRPQLEGNIDSVCDGDVYFGENAKDLSLVDSIETSEEYLLRRIQAGDRVMKLHKAHQYVGRRKLFHPLDFLRERSKPLLAACSKLLQPDVESTLSRVVTATSVMGAAQFIAHNVNLFGRNSGFGRSK